MVVVFWGLQSTHKEEQRKKVFEQLAEFFCLRKLMVVRTTKQIVKNDYTILLSTHFMFFKFLYYYRTVRSSLWQLTSFRFFGVTTIPLAVAKMKFRIVFFLINWVLFRAYLVYNEFHWICDYILRLNWI